MIKVDIEIEGAPASEFSEHFIRGMAARMAMSYHKYGLVSEGYPEKNNALESMRVRLNRYVETGNLEYLMDAANFLMIEFMQPRHPAAHFKAEDSKASPGRMSNQGVLSQAANTLQRENTRVGGFYKREGD